MAGKAAETKEPEVKTWFTATGVRVTTAMDVESLGWTDEAPTEPEKADDDLIGKPGKPDAKPSK